MQEERAKRPRITPVSQGVGIVEDPLRYVKNKTNDFTRKLKGVPLKVVFEIHYELHYRNRDQFGEDDGGVREGINIEVVSGLVEAALQHIIYYCSRQNFAFINIVDPRDGPPKRFGLQTECADGIMLNIIIETHHLDISTFELTIVTAKKKNGFFGRSGEYVIEMLPNDHSVLKMVGRNKVLQEIESI